ncbi:ATPase family AAA domain-containing protein 5 [Copidosoma floridanum]|uniref:ATPase family AAA domain-containing protein 5 n=1 Tax=Copidosoma floridanum TaxID=29053 RepID=UPI0006C96234|nr:ATPase family AAA domain-containing protein 5 [Copidosoma floridanum]
MKDITHYFIDLPKKAESAPAEMKEVRAERAKIEEVEATSTEKTNGESASVKPKKKRGRVKIKLSLKSEDDVPCDNIDNSSDPVEKTASSHDEKPKKRQRSSGVSPLAATASAKSSSEDTCQKRKKTDAPATQENEKPDQVIPKEFADSFSSADLIDNKKRKKDDEDISSKKKIKTKHTEKLIDLADKKGYLKRKVREEEEAAKIEKRFEKRKKLFTESNKNSERIQCDEDTSKNDTPNTKRNNLLNYFSKSTPEQLEKERQRNAKVTVKAQVHTPSNSPVPVAPVFDKKTKNLPKKKKSKHQDNTDEIVVIESETVILSPQSEKTSPENNKPKWSLKIQLQSNHVDSFAEDEEIYSPTLNSKSHKEYGDRDKIPKVLLPMKNKKKELSISSSNNNNSINDKDDKSGQKNLKTEKKKVKQHLKVNKEEISTSDNKTANTEVDKKNITDGVEDAIMIHVNGVKQSKNTEDDCQIIKVKTNQPGKLAPLFKKKAKPSAEMVAARRLFLQSDIQETTNDNESRKLAPAVPSVLPFPKISHVKQLPLNSDSLSKSYKFSLKSVTVEPFYDVSLMKTVTSLSQKEIISDSVHKCVKSDTETILSEIESDCPGASSLWKTLSAIKKTEIHKKPQRGRKKSEKKSSKHDTIQNELLNNPWTEKYKPNSSTEIVGNEGAAQKLKSWLDNWKSLKTNEDYSSGEEFCNSDGSSSTNFKSNQVAVLIGPHGSGKTASVYAIAQELGYKVLEVNASSKRPGKKILKDFEEATKSHRVKETSLKDMFTSKSKEPEEKKKISQNSLILMEDVDLVFEEDEGFVSAVFQLASNTKRPIVMTLQNTCFHLGKMAPQQLRIDFNPAFGKRVMALMRLIAFAETQCKLPQSCVNILCQSGDLRKGILQLQYILLSGKEHIPSRTLSSNNISWKDMLTQIYKPATKAEKRDKQTNEGAKCTNSALNNLANNLDSFSVMSTFMDIEDPTLNLPTLQSEPSLSLAENMNCYSHLDGTSLEISNWMSDSVRNLNLNTSKKLKDQMVISGCSTLKKQQILDVYSKLSNVTSNQLDRRVLVLDYLSSTRTICRAEEIRRQLNSKRGNRFFHYLQGSKISNAVMRTGNTLIFGCKMLQEKPVVGES